MTASALPIGIVLPPLVAALLIVLAALERPVRARWLALLGVGISVLSAIAALWRVADGAVLYYGFGGWAAPYGIVYRIDGLSAVMAALIGGISLAVFTYAGPSIRKEVQGREASFMALSSLLVAALQGMVVTGDLFNLYVFLEIASITAYTLIATGGGPAALASFRYLLIGTVGASFYLLGLSYLFALTGTLNMADMAARLPGVDAPAAVTVAVAFIVTGFGLKMALIPMHGWLPDAYTFAPSAATGLIAALMTKVAAYALLRVLYGVLWPALQPLHLPIAPVLGGLAAAAILVGSAMALAQRDVKRLLAYSSLGHLGYIALGLALGNRNALIGAALHIVAHAIAKCCLFLVVGGVDWKLGLRNEADWRRLARKMPTSMAALVVAAMSMIGVPPMAGFFSKWYLILGCLDAGHPVFVVVLLLSSLLNAWYFFRIIEHVYFAPEPAERHSVEDKAGGELPGAMLGPVAGLAAAAVLVGLLSGPLVSSLLDRPVQTLLGDSTAIVAVQPLGEKHGGR